MGLGWLLPGLVLVLAPVRCPCTFHTQFFPSLGKVKINPLLCTFFSSLQPLSPTPLTLLTRS